MKTGPFKQGPFSTPQYAADGWVDDTPARNILSNSAKGPYLKTFINFFLRPDRRIFIRSVSTYRYDREERPINSKKLFLR